MYSTCLSNNKYIVSCISVKGKARVANFVVDTGAMCTCCYYKVINTQLTESSLVNSEKCYMRGINNKKSGIVIYKYRVNQFTIGNIDLGARDIWITFDERISDNVLGMDLLKDVAYLQLKNTNTLFFFKDDMDLYDFILSRKSPDISAEFREYYRK